MLHDLIYLLQISRECEENKDVISAAKQGLGINRLAELDPTTRAEEAEKRILSLRIEYKELLKRPYSAKYEEEEKFGEDTRNDSYTVIKEGSRMICEEEESIDEELVTMRSLLKTSKELTHALTKKNKNVWTFLT